MKTVKAILIDPFAQTVTMIDLPDREQDYAQHADDLRELLQVETLGHLSLGDDPQGNSYHAWNDDDGLLKPWDQQAFFQAPFYPSPLCGRWLIECIKQEENEAGDDVIEHQRDALLDVQKFAAAIRWVKPQDVVVPAPVHISFDKQGNQHTTLLDGRTHWTYDDNPGKERP